MSSSAAARRKGSPIWWIVLFAAVVLGWIGVEWLGYQRVHPPAKGMSLPEFLQWKPGVQRFEVVEADGGEYLIAYGPASSLLLLSSGPSAYIFDRSGRMVDWSSDIGDDPKFDERWKAQSGRSADRKLSREQAADWAVTRLN